MTGIALQSHRVSRWVLALGALAAAVLASGVATASRSIQLSDNANLRENNHKGIELKESGSAHGNLPGSIYIQLKIYGRSVSAKIQVYPSGGSISASANASYRVVSASTATFSGSLSITGGSGRYAHAKGSNLSFSGSVHRPGNAVTVHVSGRMSY